jgi:HEAT repeat protein
MGNSNGPSIQSSVKTITFGILIFALIFGIASTLDFTSEDDFLLFIAIGIGLLLLCAVFFAASVLVLRFKHMRTAANWERLEAKWEVAILKALSGDEAQPDFLALVEKEEELFFLNYLLRYARRIKGAEKEILCQLASPYLPRVAERMSLPEMEHRARAVQFLGELGLKTFANEVISALDDPSPMVAMIAARALTNKEHPQHGEAVLAKIHRFTNWSPTFLSSMLASIGPEVAPALRRTFGDEDGETTARAIAGSALALLNDIPSADIAARALSTESEGDLLAASLRILGKVGRPEHVAIVRQSINSQEPAVRASAASALGRFGEPQDVGLLLMAYQDESRWVAIHAARALRDRGETAALNNLANPRKPRASLAMQVLSELD